MPATLTRTPRSQRHTPSSDELARFQRQGRCVTDCFSSCRIGGMLFRKLLGFIEDERAEILSVSESHVTLRLGQPWLRRMSGVDRRRPIEVRIQFAQPGEDPTDWETTRARRSAVNVLVRPMTRWYATRDFHRRADSILHQLRMHFVAD